MKTRFIIGIIVSLLFFAVGIVGAGNSFGLYCDPLSLLFAVILPHILISFMVPFSMQKRLMGEILSKEKGDGPTLKEGVAYLKSLKRMIISCTVATMILGIIGILAHLEDPQAIGPNFAVALIALFYSSLYILIVIEPLRLAAETKLAGESESNVR